MAWSLILGLVALTGLAQATPSARMMSEACEIYQGTCMSGGCQEGQTYLGHECSSGRSCCRGEVVTDKPNPRLNDVCGSIMGKSSRIIGGETYAQCTIPYSSMVALRFFFATDLSNLGNITFCAGSLIDEDLVVTTANCIAPYVQGDGAALLSNIRVVVGEYDSYRTDYGNDGAPEDRAKIREAKVHPNYNSASLDNNIALIRLDRKIKYNNCKIPACLPRRAENVECGQVQNECQMAGFGTRFADEFRPFPRPGKANVRVFDKSTSSGILRYVDGLNPEGSMVVEPIQAQQKACVFDWGGIVMCPRDGRWELSGLISFHSCLENGNIPLIAVDIAQYRGWIESCAADFTQCIL
ncbi:chymotrypsinogen A [Patella vulgata]|uniref:chymotrypsinogen A n=1 Tax=Patella vulgata TaxID=6465 RepID=UPI00217F4FC5|nr:chymotrypsinogen A [Patella vulgata]